MTARPTRLAPEEGRRPIGVDEGPTLDGVPGVIDGRHWLRQRIVALEEALQGDLTVDQRGPIEAELAVVRSELARRRGWRHWLLWGTRPVP